jgi:hypothetical protein
VAVQERVALLGGRVTEFSQRFDGIESQMRAFEERVDRRFEGTDRRIDALDAKVSRQFMWLVGLHVMTLTAITGALLAR